MTKRHVVQLNDEQRANLIKREDGPLTRRQRNRVQVLLRSDSGDTDQEIADDLDISLGTVANVRRPGAVPVLDGKAEAIVIATACSPVPDGRATWMARMLANRLVELQVVESISEDTILRVLKKASSSRGRRRRGACPRA